MKIFIASDHGGIELKAAIQNRLNNHEWMDLGTQNPESVDYPDYASQLCKKLIETPSALGILICKSGIGMSIAANKFNGIRAAHVGHPSEAKVTREHNHSNVLCLGASYIAPDYAVEIIEAWLGATPSQLERHLKRVRKVCELE